MLPPSAGYRRQDEGAALLAATEVLEKRGDAPRLKRNRLIFMAPDGDAVQPLRDAARTWLAWKSIVEDVQDRRMDLGTYQADQAKRAMDGAEDGLKQMVRETYRWLMVPTEEMVRGKLVLRWEAGVLSASAPTLVDAIESKLKEEEWLVSAWSPVHLNRMLNQWYFKEGIAEVSALRVWQDSCQYLYLPRLMNSDVFVQSVTAGCGTRDGFAFAAGKDEERWLGFSFGQSALVTLDSDSLLVSHQAAVQHQQRLDEEKRERQASQAGPVDEIASRRVEALEQTLGQVAAIPTVNAATMPNRFFGMVEVDATTATMDFSTIVNEVVQHFAAQSGVDVTVNIEIEARSKQGFESGLQRVIKENCGVLKFRSANFERE